MDPRERIAFLRGPAGERALLARLVAGEDQAYRECYELHAPGIMRVLMRVLGDRSQAEDVIQETFVAAFGAIGSFRQEARLSSWLTAIALRRALNVRRGESRRLKNLPPAQEEPSDTTTRQLIGRNLTSKVLAVLETMETPKRLALLLQAEGYTAAEIADMTEEPRGTVLSRLARARAELAERVAAAGLGDHGEWFQEEHGT